MVGLAVGRLGCRAAVAERKIVAEAVHERTRLGSAQAVCGPDAISGPASSRHHEVVGPVADARRGRILGVGVTEYRVVEDELLGQEYLLTVRTGTVGCGSEVAGGSESGGAAGLGVAGIPTVLEIAEVELLRLE